MFLGKVPAVGDVQEEDLAKLPEEARKVVEMCCGAERESAGEVRRVIEAMFTEKERERNEEYARNLFQSS